MNDHFHALSPGHHLGDYCIESVLGSGGFGITYYARDVDIGKAVAIKEYFPNEFALRIGTGTVKPKSTDDQDNYKWGLERFLEEARILARFKHPHLNEVYRFFEDNGTAYIALEYIEGETLSQILRREKQLESTRLGRLLEELLSGLEEVHEAGFVHRDIKPGNIILRKNGTAVLLDFGAARQVIGQRSKNITAMFTPGYAPIEQYDLRGADIGPWTDLYALGMVAYRCISGIREGELLDAVARNRLESKGEKSKDLAPAVKLGKGRYDSALLTAVDWAIRVDEERRPKSVAAMRKLLEYGGKRTSQNKHPGSRYEREVEAERKRFAEIFGRDPSPRVKDDDGITDLHYAAAANMSALTRFLLDAGADVYARTKGDNKPITDTSEKKLQQLTKTKIWHFLHSATPLHWAMLLNARDTAELLISHGADVLAKNTYGGILLDFAAKHNARDTAELLISRGADVLAKSKYGNTSLHWAAKHNAWDTAALLISRGADVLAKNKYGSTPLHFAAQCKLWDIAELLIGRGADVQAKNKYGSTPLHWAAEKNVGGIALSLIFRGADVLAKDKYDNTPLHFAAQHNARDTADWLISWGADVQAKDKNGNTPLHWAVRKNARDTAELLISHGADVHAKNKNGLKPWELAARNEHSEMSDLLRLHVFGLPPKQ